MSGHRVIVALTGLCMLAACTAAVPYAAPATARAEERIDWNQAIELLRSGRVAAVVQLHDLSVTLTTADDRRYVAKEPAIDAILAAITMHAPNAQAIVVATE